MVSTQRKEEQNRRFFSQLFDFDQDVFLGDEVKNESQNLEVNDSPASRGRTVNNKDRIASTNENTTDDQTLWRNLTDRIAKEMSYVVETVEDRIQNHILNTT